VFGKEDEDEYLDKYAIKEFVEDKTTLRLRYTHAPKQNSARIARILNS
jgi:type I site-specific restriction-modification system R (restriction) subunit